MSRSDAVAARSVTATPKAPMSHGISLDRQLESGRVDVATMVISDAPKGTSAIPRGPRPTAPSWTP